MAVLPILVAPHPVLKKKCVPVDSVTQDIRSLMADMLETMYVAPGVGLAAPQVGVSKRVLVVDCARTGEDPAPIKMANPTIVWASKELETYEEGCLSFPEQYADVRRPAECHVSYLDENNKKQLLKADGLMATCVQHEMDHLEGIVFVDHISTVKRSIIMRRLKKQQRQKGEAA